MSSDRELLELAAKAEGIEIEWDARGPYRVVPGVSGNDKCWNPLTEDGDAFRLAVKLGISVIQPTRPEDRGVVALWGDNGVRELAGDDASAATRRAIVRAAAELGRTMATTATPRATDE